MILYVSVKHLYVSVWRRAIIIMYNVHMGGFYLNYKFIAATILITYIIHYHTCMRTPKWPVRAYANFLDLVTVNSLVLYMTYCRSSDIPKKYQIILLESRVKFVKCNVFLCLQNNESLRKLHTKRCLLTTYVYCVFTQYITLYNKLCMCF